MKSKLVEDRQGERRYVIILDPGEDPMERLGQFARDNDIEGASLTAIGAFSRDVAPIQCHVV